MALAGLSALPAACKNSATWLRHKALRSSPAMRNIYRSLLLVLAGATQKELIRQNRYLKIENQALRNKLPVRLQFTMQERRRLARFAARRGAGSPGDDRPSRHDATVDSGAARRS
jgi:hypothetical protein